MVSAMETATSTLSLPDWLGRRASTHADTEALRHAQGTWTYRDLYERAGELAGALAERGVRPGDRVAVLMRHGLAYAWVAHALIQVGAILVPINTRLALPEMAWIAEDAEAKWLLHDDAHDPAARALCSDGLRAWNVERELDRDGVSSARLYRDRIALDDVQVLIYTSGTTGRPKGAMLTYGNQWWSAVGSALQLGVLPGDQWLVPMPLFHVGGLAVLMRSVINGTTAVIHDQFRPEDVHRAIDEEGVQLLSVVPTMLQRMLDVRGDKPYPPSLRCVLVGGSAAPQPILERCLALRMPVAQSYGLSEANSQVATLRPVDALRKLGSSGKPLMPTEVAIWADGQPAPAGVVGEIIVRGPTLTRGYWRRPDATAEAFMGEWFRTGDIGYLDDEGYLYVLDRRTDLIVSGGENVYPAEVEAVLHAHPAVREAGVVGRPDAEWGQVPVAFVVLRAGAQVAAEELQAFCVQRLAKYKVPRDIRFVQSLPRNAGGKLLRRTLRAWL